MNVGGLTSAANRAVNSFNNISQKVEDVANTVAAGFTTGSDDPSNSDGKQDEVSRAIANLPGLRLEAAANARVVATTETLLAELGSLTRQ